MTTTRKPSTPSTRKTTTTDLLDQQEREMAYATGRIRTTKAAIRKHRAVINKTAKIFQSLLNAAQVEAQVGCYTDAYWGRCEVMMYADISGDWIDSLRHPALLSLFEAVETNLGQIEETTDYTWRENPTRSYALTIPLGTDTSPTDTIKIKITVTVAADSATCRKVQVGTKVESVPVYEIQCA